MSINTINKSDEVDIRVEKPISFKMHRWVWFAAVISIILMLLLRFVAMDSDAYSKLSWSTALLTDEGFYTHDARNLVLFGQEHTDGFNNALIMPTLHYLQVIVFKLAGVGVIQARLISIVLSLLMLIIFYRTVWRVFGTNAAAIATLFLGLDHTNLLYNRMALMDTPAAFLMTIVLWIFIRAYDVSSTTTLKSDEVTPNIAQFWWILCGLMLIISYATRGVAALLIPAPFIVLLFCKDIPLKRGLLPLSIGLLIGITVYKICWISPHQAEMTKMSRYYFSVQLIPHSIKTFYFNLRRAWTDSGGLLPYLFKHTAIQMLLATMCGFLIIKRTWKNRLTNLQFAFVLFCGVWIYSAWLAFMCINYAPSRYYVLFYPAMAALGGIALSRPTELIDLLCTSSFSRAFLSFFILYYLMRSADFMQAGALQVVGFAICCAVFGIMWRLKLPLATRKPSMISAALLALWFGLNFCWTFDWLSHLTYRQIEADRWLDTNLPESSVLFGAVAPGLCMNNHFKAVNVIARLCNDDHPIERFPHVPRYIIILDDNRFDSKWKEQWWVRNYPKLLRKENRIHSFPGLLRPFFTIGLYAVPENEYTEIPAK